MNDYADMQHSTTGTMSNTHIPPSSTQIDVINQNPVVHSTNTTSPPQYEPTPSSPQTVPLLLTKKDPSLIEHVTPSLTPTPIPPPITNHDTASLGQDISAAFAMPYIRAGMYPSTSSHTPTGPNLPPINLHDTGTQESFTAMHVDFNHMQDIIDYHELCYTVASQLKYDARHPPSISFTPSPTHPNITPH